MTNAPKGAKNPQDRKPKKEASIVEASFEFEGQTYTVDRDVLDDLYLIQDVMDAKTDLDGLRLMPRIVGAEQWQRMEDSIRTEDGRIPATKAMEFVRLASEPLGKFAASLTS